MPPSGEVHTAESNSLDTHASAPSASQQQSKEKTQAPAVNTQTTQRVARNQNTQRTITTTSKRSSNKPPTIKTTTTRRKPQLRVGGSNSQTKKEDDKARKGAIFLGFVVVAYIIYLVVTGQMASFAEALSTVDLWWVFLACICFVFYFIFGVGAYAIAVWLDPESPVGIRDLMSVEATGIFFGNLTPMMAGAVPAQIVRLTRTGQDPGEAMATQFTRFIVFQFAVVLFAAIALLARFEFFRVTYGNIVFLNLVVFFAHFIELVVLFVICLCPGFVKRVGNAGIDFLSSRNIIKQATYEKWNETINVQVDEFSTAFKRAAVHIPSMALTLLVTMLQLASLYMIPWFVLRAFGKNADFWSCLAAGSMVQMVASAVPLPGGSGGAEGGFALFYGPLFGTASAAGFLIWRVVTFFAPTILSAPLLGLRSTSHVSIYHRWERLTGKKSGNARVRMQSSHSSSSTSGKSGTARRGAGSSGKGVSVPLKNRAKANTTRSNSRNQTKQSE
ncbi:MAG: flippase-like domain-containing protein [Atopobiaceae bacterium]|nr:flippase-like domain-containing protein [Atopobiaceae bacterium]